MAQRVHQIIVQAKGREEVRALQEALRQEEAALRSLVVQLQAGGIASADFARRSQASGAVIASLQDDLVKAERAFGSAGGRAVNFSQAMLQSSRAVQDFAAAGLLGVVNNVESIAAAFGAGAGLAGGVTLAVVALQAFGPTLKGLVSTFITGEQDVNRFGSALDKVGAEVKALEDAEVTLAVDTFELDQAQIKLAALRRAADEFAGAGPGRRAQESGRLLADLLAEQPGGERALADRLKTQRVRELEAVPGSAVGVAKAELVKAQAALKFEEDIQAAGPAEGGELTLALLRRQAELAAENLRKARVETEKSGGTAETDVGDILLKAKAGDERAQADLAKRIGTLGGTDEEREGYARLAQEITGTLPTGERIPGAGVSPRALAEAEAEDRAERLRAEADEQAKAARLARERQDAQARRKAEQRARELAGNLQGRFDVDYLRDVPIGPQQVKRQLVEGQGLSPAEADALAGPVLESLKATLLAALEKKAGERGITPEAATDVVLAERLVDQARAAEAARKTGAEAIARGFGGIDTGAAARAQTLSFGGDLARFGQKQADSEDQAAVRELRGQTDILKSIDEKLGRPQPNPRLVLSGTAL